MTPYLVIGAAWLINAAMDAIDHAKGAETLGTLWHVLKWLSYAIPAGYIFLRSGIPAKTLFWTIPLFMLALKILWESVYRYLREIHFEEYDK